jgi:hypothetical protein
MRSALRSILAVTFTLLPLVATAQHHPEGEQKLKAAPKPPVAVSLNASKWEITPSASSLMPLHPTPLAGMAGWVFAFPQMPGYVGYVTVPFRTDITRRTMLTFTAQIVAAPGTVFRYDTEAFNTCQYPAHARAYLEKRGINWRAAYHRWWSNPLAMELDEDAGTVTMVMPLTPGAWSSVHGELGSLNVRTRRGFADVLAHMGRIGLTFGGGCFFGHGVFIDGGPAQFILTNYAVQ